MNHRSFLALLLALLAAPGCKSVLTSLAEAGPWGTMMRAAPIVPNPATSHEVSPVEATDQAGRIRYRITSFAPEGLCFSFTAPYSPEETSAIPFAVEALATSMDDRPGYGGSDDLKASNRVVRVIDARSEVRLVEEWVNGVALRREKTFYTTQAEVCFPDPKIPTAESRFLLLYSDGPIGGLDSYAVWQLR